jgi:hypothetical protein
MPCTHYPFSSGEAEVRDIFAFRNATNRRVVGENSHNEVE